jgi:hypothetical protein
MSSQERNQHALQRLMKYIAPRLYENEPDSEQSERALRALSGQLGSLPPYVIDAFDLGVAPSAYIWSVAISSEGKIAIVVGEPEGSSGFSKARLTTWPRPRGYSELLNLGLVKDDATVRVLFPEGSDTPAVVIGGEKIVWGNWTLELPWKEELEVRKSACLTLWEDRDHLYNVAFLEDGEIHFQMTVVGGYDKPHAKNVRWIGYVGRELLAIHVTKHGRDILLCRGKEVEMCDGYKIETDSITARSESIQFVAYSESDQVYKVFDVAIECTGESQEAEVCIWGDGRVFAFSRESLTISDLDFSGRWRKVGVLTEGQLPIKSGRLVFDLGDQCVVAESDGKPGQDRLVTIYKDDRIATTPIVKGPKTGFVRAHSGIMYQTIVTGTGGFIWSALDNVLGNRPLTKTFPLYNRFDQLTPVEDERGKAIMGWGYAEGTFAVVRYPLPIR